MNYRKILAAVLSIALVLCLAACGGKTTTPTPSGGTAQTVKTDAEGMIFLSMGAEIKIDYDKEGKTMTVEPANEAAQDILAESPVGTGVACNVAVADLVKATVAASTSDLKVILIKQAFGSTSPSKEFLGAIQADAEAAAGSCKVVVVGVDELTADGYLPIDAVKAIFMANIGADSAVINVTEDLATGTYYVSHKDGDITSNYAVDADNGVVTYLEDEPTIEVLTEEETLADENVDAESNVPSADEFYMEETPDTEPVFPEDINDNASTEETFGDEEMGGSDDQEEPEATIPDDAPTA